MTATIERLDFEGSAGAKLSARLDRPAGKIRAFALFAHCFTCSKDLNAARRIAGELARLGIAVLRFDFTGLGSSEGEFASTNFSSNVQDLKVAADYLREHFEAPQLLIGHSLGGAAVLSVAADLPEVRAVATIGAPADAAHVAQNFVKHIETINQTGEAEVVLGGRKFCIRQQFVDDLETSVVTDRIAHMSKALLVLHSPVDETVGVENAAQIFTAAKHPKSFISLDGADHLLNKEPDAIFAARTISAWAERYLDVEKDTDGVPHPNGVIATETHNGKFQTVVRVGPHRLIADEPKSYGGMDSGPSPYDFLATALATCTVMTLRMYADRKKLDIGTVSVGVEHAKVHGIDSDQDTSEGKPTAKIDVFARRLSFSGDLDAEMQAKMLEIADKCPVHRTLESDIKITTELVNDPDSSSAT